MANKLDFPSEFTGIYWVQNGVFMRVLYMCVLKRAHDVINRILVGVLTIHARQVIEQCVFVLCNSMHACVWVCVCVSL